MKIRNGFITNSSSSSFIISTDEKNINELKKVKKILDLLPDYGEGTETEIITSLDSLAEYMKEERGVSVLDIENNKENVYSWHIELYEDFKKKVLENKIILASDIAYGFCDMFEELCPIILENIEYELDREH